MLTSNPNNSVYTHSTEANDDLSIKVSVIATNGSETLIDMHSSLDLPYALRKDALTVTAVGFKTLLEILFTGPLGCELNRILEKRYQQFCAEEKAGRQSRESKKNAVNGDSLSVNPDFVPTTPALLPSMGIEPPPWSIKAAIADNEARRKVA